VNTTTLAAALAGFLLGGLTVSVAAELEEEDTRPAHGSSYHRSVQGTPVAGMIGLSGPLKN